MAFRLRLRSVGLVVGLLGPTLSLVGCGLSDDLPERGFLTRYVMGWDASDQPVTAERQRKFVNKVSTDKACRDLAQTRTSDATLNQSVMLNASDLKRIYDLTYADCVKWRDK